MTRRPLSSMRLSVPPSASAVVDGLVDLLGGLVGLEHDLAGDVLHADLDLHGNGLSSGGAADAVPQTAVDQANPPPGQILPCRRRAAPRPRRGGPAPGGAVPSRSALGKAAEAAPGEGRDEPGRLVAGDRGALGEPVPGADLGHAGQRHPEQVRLGLGQVGVLGDDLGDRLGAA